MCNINHVFLNT